MSGKDIEKQQGRTFTVGMLGLRGLSRRLAALCLLLSVFFTAGSCAFAAEQSLVRPFAKEQGHAWVVPLPGLQDMADDRSNNMSSVKVLENGKTLGPAHSLHDQIRRAGGGRYSHWSGYLYFSTSDNSDPNTNGRKYSISVTVPAASENPVSGPALRWMSAFLLGCVAGALTCWLALRRRQTEREAGAEHTASASARPKALWRVQAPRVVLAILLGLLSVGAVKLYMESSGWLVFFSATLAITTLLAAARLVLGLVLRGSLPVFLANMVLMFASVGLTLVLLELGFRWTTSASSEASTQLTMPDEWKRRPVNIEGATRAAYWHGKLHVYNADNFRNIGDYKKEEDKYRVVALGDSMTYGDGVAAEDTYVALLEKIWKEREPSVRVYNLGADGAQSEDILRIADKWLPLLRPQQVVYGICLNDFLPSYVGQYSNNMAWQVPLPKKIKAPFETRTKVGAFITDVYNRALMAAGIRNDFFTDILKDFGNYQGRFSKDLAALNKLVLSETGRPVVAMVVDQFPASAKGYAISRIAEKAARDAGMDVVPTENYYKKYATSSEQLHVSKWEGHPNEAAHRIFAQMLAQHLTSGREQKSY